MYNGIVSILFQVKIDILVSRYNLNMKTKHLTTVFGFYKQASVANADLR